MQRQYQHIAAQLIALQKADLALRQQLVENGQLWDGYHPEMAQLHNAHADVLDDIISVMGFPSIDKVGEEACDAAWLVIQHAIGKPDFMRRCKMYLQQAINEKQVSPTKLAYLVDRIAVFEGKKQLYGSQFDWDANGELSPNPIVNPEQVNERRKSLGLPTIEEQTNRIRMQAAQENQKPPVDLEAKKAQMDEWRKKVGWIQ